MLFFVLTFNLHIYKVDESEKSLMHLWLGHLKKNPVLIVIYLDLFLLDIDDKHTTIMKSEIWEPVQMLVFS